jgi:hypothetical protein
MHMARPDRLAILRGQHGHRGAVTQDLRQRAFVAGADMSDDDEAHRQGRHGAEHRLQGLDPAGRGADAHHRNAGMRPVTRRGGSDAPGLRAGDAPGHRRKAKPDPARGFGSSDFAARYLAGDGLLRRAKSAFGCRSVTDNAARR